MTITDGQLPWVIGLSCAIAVMAASLLVLAWDSVVRRRERMRRGRSIVAKAMADPVEAAYSDAVGIALAPTLRDDPISLLRMHIAVDAALDRARDGQDITEDAPKEWVP